jgi:Mrp family chromosome partitioning ATPase
MTEGAPLRYYLDVLRRRKWLVLPLLVLTPIIAYAITAQQHAVYKASADVLLNRQNLAANLTGVADTTSLQDPQRFGQTQAELARVPEIARRTLAAAGITNQSAGWLLGSSSVSPQPNADLLTFSVSTGSPALSEQLATEYGRQYVGYSGQLDTSALTQALSEAQSRLAKLRAVGDTTSTLAASLQERVVQIGTLLAIRTPSSTLVRTADSAVQTAPRPTRNALLALAIAFVLSLALAFFVEAIDTRVTAIDEIDEATGLQLLARVPPARRVAGKRPSMLGDPYGPQSEAYRALRGNLDFVNLTVGARTIMITSAIPGEGKTTTTANLALALGATGRNVVLCDFDVRNPSLGGMFDARGARGLVDAVLDGAQVETLLVPIQPSPTASLPPYTAGSTNGNQRTDLTGRVELLPFGRPVPNPGEFLASHEIGAVLERLCDRADVVLIDAPPLLPVGDVLLLGTRVDAILLVARVNMIRRPQLSEVRRLLEMSSAAKLGFVATGVKSAQLGYGYGMYRGAPRKTTEALT